VSIYSDVLVKYRQIINIRTELKFYFTPNTVLEEAMYCKKVDFLPLIPEELIDDLPTIKSRGNQYKPEDEHTYSSFVVSPELESYLQSFFDTPIKARYQYIIDQLPIHLDEGGSHIKYNYLLTTGGKHVTTRWWDSLQNPQEIIYEIEPQTHVWYELTVNVPHDISPVESYRLSVVIYFPAD